MVPRNEFERERGFPLPLGLFLRTLFEPEDAIGIMGTLRLAVKSARTTRTNRRIDISHACNYGHSPSNRMEGLSHLLSLKVMRVSVSNEFSHTVLGSDLDDPCSDHHWRVHGSHSIQARPHSRRIRLHQFCLCKEKRHWRAIQKHFETCRMQRRCLRYLRHSGPFNSAKHSPAACV
jgi:hypothetical protein